MAFPVTPLDKLSTVQFDILAGARNSTGFHGYYSGGLDARKRHFEFIAPGQLPANSSMTFFFENLSAAGAPESYLRFGLYNHHKQSYLELSMSSTSTAAKLVADNNSAGFTALPGATSVVGPHVLQLRMTNTTLELELDSTPFTRSAPLPRAFRRFKINHLVVFYSDDGLGNKAPFIFYEGHWNVPDILEAIHNDRTTSESQYTLHQGAIELRVGGYVLWNASWRNDVKIEYAKSTIASLSNPNGETVVIMKMYRDGFTVAHAKDTATAAVNTTHSVFTLKDLKINEPASMKEYKSVSGEILY